jgi:ribosomal protein S12 methylthiotransferase accessory factor
VLRATNPRTTVAGLRAALHDRRLGPVAHVSRAEGLPLAIAHAEVVADWVERDGGYGRATTFAGAERIALFEAVERMCGLSPRGTKTVLRCSYAELGPSRALDPCRLGMHEPASHDHPTFRLTPYTPQVRTTWVYGWSVRDQAAIAVPEQVAYWGHPPAPREDGMAEFMFESSNGCGLGNSPEEACLYSLFEIAERDAFLMAWYTQAALTRVAVPYEDETVAHLTDRLDALGYGLRIFDTTNDFGIPAVLVVALCHDTESPAPQAFFSAGAHHDPLTAIRSAIVEITVNLVQSTNVARAKPWYFDRDRLRTMVGHPDRVCTIDDHIALYTLPEMRERYRFLLDAVDPQPWQVVWPGRPHPVTDVGALLRDLLDGVLRAGMDVIVVDQSDALIRAELGLHATRVIVPGAVPLTFAHVYRRTLGLPRLIDVPRRLGWIPESTTYADLNLDPHPFP